MTRADLAAVAVGAVALGSGGGGDPRPLVELVAATLDPAGVPLIQVGELSEEALVAPLVIMGSTLVMQEKLPSGVEIPRAFAAMRRWLGREVTAVIPLEVAGVNALVAIAAAARVGVPLVDADLAGRALPRLDQFGPALCGYPASPCVLADPGGAVTVIDGASWQGTEAALRGQVAGSGGWGVLLCPPLTATQVARAAIAGSYTRAVRIGERLCTTAGDLSPHEAAQAVEGRLLGHGRVATITPGRHGSHSVVVRCASGTVMRVVADSEYLAVFEDGVLVAACPDIIALVDPRGRELPGPQQVRPGHDLAVVALPGFAWWAARPGPGGMTMCPAAPRVTAGQRS